MLPAQALAGGVEQGFADERRRPAVAENLDLEDVAVFDQVGGNEPERDALFDEVGVPARGDESDDVTVVPDGLVGPCVRVIGIDDQGDEAPSRRSPCR